jgi:hypothetical protein
MEHNARAARRGWLYGGRRTTAVGDHLDVPLEDATLMEEVELISTLMIAAGESDEPLDPQRIDQLLGLGPQVPEQHDHRAT